MSDIELLLIPIACAPIILLMIHAAFISDESPEAEDTNPSDEWESMTDSTLEQYLKKTEN